MSATTQENSIDPLRARLLALQIELEAKERVIQSLKQECDHRLSIIEEMDQALKEAAAKRPPSLLSRLIPARNSNLSPLERLTAGGHALAADSRLVFHLDQPASPQLTSRDVILLGWCYHALGMPLTGIRAKVGGRVFVGVQGLAREDVARHFNSALGTTNSGFKIELRVPKRRSEVILEICSEDGEWIPFCRKEFHCKVRPIHPRIISWLRFLLKYRQGFASAWGTLPQAERQALKHFLETRDRLNLGRFAQYPPRAIQPDQFPRRRFDAHRLPKITIVTPSYNQAAYLAQTMDSVLDQNYPKLDYLVLDGESKDNSVDLISQRSHRLKYWVSERDRGQSHALCKGFARTDCAPDDIVAYLNSDDLIMPGVLHFVGEYFARHHDVDAVYGHRIIIDENGQEIGRWVLPHHDEEVLKAVDFVPQETLFWRRRIHDRAGGIDASFRFAMDWDLLLRLVQHGAKIKRLPYFMGCFRVHSAQKTSAQINDVGTREMKLLRERIHGRDLSYEEILQLVERSQIESGICATLLAKGLRH